MSRLPSITEFAIAFANVSLRGYRRSALGYCDGSSLAAACVW